MVLTRIGPVSAAKLAGALYAILGLIFGLIISLFSVLGFTFADQAQPGGPLIALLFGVGAVVVLPVFYGLMGFLSTLLLALVYNGMARLCGGVVLEFQSIEAAGTPAVPPGSIP